MTLEEMMRLALFESDRIYELLGIDPVPCLDENAIIFYMNLKAIDHGEYLTRIAYDGTVTRSWTHNRILEDDKQVEKS